MRTLQNTFARVSRSVVRLQGVVIRPRHVLIVGLAILIFTTGWHFGADRYSKTLAMQRGFITRKLPSDRSQALVSVILRPVSRGYRAVLEIQVESDYGTGYRIKELGQAMSVPEAIEKWGRIDWLEEGLRVGNGTNKFILPKSDLESEGR